MSHTPNVDRFISEYPTEVNQLAIQYFCQAASTPESEAKLFSALSRWRASRRWRSGYVKSAENWIRSGDWMVAPKEAEMGQSRPTAQSNEEIRRQQRAEWDSMSVEEKEVVYRRLKELDRELEGA